MESTYDKFNIDQTYNTARELPAGTSRQWIHATRSHIPGERVNHILDLGSGTGRFSPWLAEAFDADVIAVEPSEKMRQHALKNNPLPQRITVVPGSGESIPVADASVDMVFMSMVYHHLPDAAAALYEVRRVLRLHGYLVIRNTTKENLPHIPLFEFFPSARIIDEQRLPDRQELIQKAECAGLQHLIVTPIKQLFAQSYDNYLAKLSQRSVSTLQLIPDADFSLGIKRLEEYCIDHGNEVVYEEHDLFIAWWMK